MVREGAGEGAHVRQAAEGRPACFAHAAWQQPLRGGAGPYSLLGMQQRRASAGLRAHLQSAPVAQVAGVDLGGDEQVLPLDAAAGKNTRARQVEARRRCVRVGCACTCLLLVVGRAGQGSKRLWPGGSPGRPAPAHQVFPVPFPCLQFQAGSGKAGTSSAPPGQRASGIVGAITCITTVQHESTQAVPPECRQAGRFEHMPRRIR